MKTKRSISVTLCRAFFVVLFTYTLINKFNDFENFKAQIVHAPNLADIGILTAYTVLILLFLTILLLSFTSTHEIGLLLTFILLSLFTLYNAVLLIFFENRPCTCIGFYEKWSWEVNLGVNIGLLLIVVYGIYKSISSSITSDELDLYLRIDSDYELELDSDLELDPDLDLYADLDTNLDSDQPKLKSGAEPEKRY
ncbi:MauE/DoxX family redox-associated membrane protein [Chryseobacterium sp. A301]